MKTVTVLKTPIKNESKKMKTAATLKSKEKPRTC